MDSRKLEWPASLSHIISAQLQELGYDINNIKPLASAIIEISDSYNQDTNKSPWDRPKYQAAYMAYFFPLNVLRIMSALKELTVLNFFKSTHNALEIGSGCGTFDVACRLLNIDFNKKHNVEINNKAISLHKDIIKGIAKNKQAQYSNTTSGHTPKKSGYDLFVSSYTLNELSAVPEELYSAKTIFIIEPATQNYSRKLLAIRQELINKGFFAWAPCAHQLECPLLKNSKTDWCYDRVHINKPEWFTKLENHLPNYNNSLTFSYLALSKEPSPIANLNLVRTIGDTLKEKGKHKQMVCNNDERKFFSWLKKNGKPQFLERGLLYDWPKNPVIKSDEVRPQEDVTLYKPKGFSPGTTA